MLISLLLTSIAFACTLPEKAVVKIARPLENGAVALLEENTNCVFMVAPEGPKILSSFPLKGIPSDFTFHSQSQKIYFYYPKGAEIRSLSLSSLTEKLETKLPTTPQCSKKTENGIEIETCQPVLTEKLSLNVSEGGIFLSSPSTLLGANINNFKFQSLRPHNWYFTHEIQFDSTSGRLLALNNLPSGESIVNWYLINNKLALLAPLPAPSLLSSGIKKIYFLPSGEYFFVDSGLVYRTDTMQISAQIKPFDAAYFLEEGLVGVKAEENLFKATIYNANLRPERFAYFSQKPLLFTGSAGEKILHVVLTEGSLPELFRPIEGIAYE